MGATVTRWAIVGSGPMVANVAADLWTIPDVQLTAVLSGFAGDGERFAREWQIPHVFVDLDALLASTDIDVVYLATPHPDRFTMAQAVIRAGKHVLVEKPLALTADNARELAALAREFGVFLMEAMWMRFLPAVRKSLELVEAGDIGPVRSVHASYGYPLPPDPESAMWRPETGGGSTFDQGVYTATLAYLVFGKPHSIVARGVLSPTGIDCDVTALLEYSNDETANLTTSTTTFLPMTAAICGTIGRIGFSEGFWQADRIDLARTDNTSDVFEFTPEMNSYAPMLHAVHEAVVAGQLDHPMNPMGDTIDVIEILEEIVQQVTENTSATIRTAG